MTTTRRRHHTRLVVVATSVALLVTGLVLARPATASSRPAVAVRVGGVPAVAGAVALGAVPASTSLRLVFALRPRDPVALAVAATAVSTPGSPRYGAFLAKGRFAAAFGPTSADVAATERWLRASGLGDGTLSANHLSIAVTARAATVERALAVRLARYALPGGRQAYANTVAPLVPASLARVVAGVVGLDDVDAPLREDVTGAVSPDRPWHAPHVAGAGPSPCAAAKTAGSAQHAYTADQLATAYDVGGLYASGDEGAGTTVAVLELEPNLTSDVAGYQACYGTDATVAYHLEGGGAGTGTGDGEAALDIETAIGVAPKAHFDVYQAPDTHAGTIADLTAIVDADTAQVVTTSWGRCESRAGASFVAQEVPLFEQAAVQGQAVFVASGDNGSSDCQNAALAVNDPASQPFVTGVGGTTLSKVGPPPTETVWNESAKRTGAGGGGLSSDHVMPSYQSSAAAALHVVSTTSSGVPCGAAKGLDCREVPDVSADSDRSTGYLIYYKGRWSANGGTSAAAPLWAGLLSLVDASSACNGRSIGFANPALYDAAASDYTADFHDVTSGNNDYTPYGLTSGEYAAGPGYDLATGLGTPDAAGLAATLCGQRHTTVAATSTSLVLSAPSVTYGGEGAELFTATVTGAPGDGQPQGTVVVRSASTTLCSRTLVAHAADAATIACRTGHTALHRGTHPDVVATYVPTVASSSVTTVRYTASDSRPASFTVVRDRTTTKVTLAPRSVVVGAESAAVVSVLVRSRLGEPVPLGDRAVVRVGTASCLVVLHAGAGTCSIGASALRPGRYAVVATFKGDGDLMTSRATAAARLTVSRS